VVYEARNKVTDYIVVAKIMRSDCPKSPLAVMEHSLQKLSASTNAVELFDVYWSPYYAVFLMERCTESLRDLCRRREVAFGDKPVGAIFYDLLRGLAHMHGKGVLHRDLHSGNSLVNNSIGNVGDVVREQLQCTKIVDFGKAFLFASASSPELYTMGTATCGALEVVPPEIWFRKGVQWNITSSAGKQKIVAAFKPRSARYNGGVDVWAAGVDLVLVLGAKLFTRASSYEGPAAFTAAFGKIPFTLVEELGWSVPSCLISQITVKPAASSLVNAEVFAKVISTMLHFDPRKRGRVQTLSSVFEALSW
jgi:serine/threonine protein kinase